MSISKRLGMGYDRGSWPPSPGNRILQRLNHTCCTAKTSPGGLLSQALGTEFVLRQLAPVGSPQTLQCPQCLSQALGQLLGGGEEAPALAAPAAMGRKGGKLASPQVGARPNSPSGSPDASDRARLDGEGWGWPFRGT